MAQRLADYPSYLFVRFRKTFPFVLPQTPEGVAYNPNKIDYGCIAAGAFFDSAGNPVAAQTDMLYFDYVTEEMWNNADVSNPCGTIVWDVDADLAPGALDLYLSDNSFFAGIFLEVLRISGYWENSRFVPVTVERMYEGLNPLPSSTKEYWELDQVMDLPWEMIFDRSDSVDRPLEVIYGLNAGGSSFDRRESQGSITINGKHYFSPTQLLFECAKAQRGISVRGLTNTVCVLARSFTVGEEAYDAYAVVQCNPLEYAIMHLWHVYLVSFAILALIIVLLLRRIYRSLVYPLQAGQFGIAQEHGRVWHEPYAVIRSLQQTKQALTESENKVQQLTTALEYAKNAEENRRQLVSNLAHELKTPLAVTHSYAEGLQEGIAPEKEDHYLSVILEETERMDALVLQMLELSRLEAGKVKLAADRFDLTALVKSVFDKLQPGLEEKELTLSYPVAEPAEITADLERITQVVQNLATNAIKYTPSGGRIYVRVFHKKTTVRFSIENTCPPLDEEALQKVWESFYRADNSRSSEGTGLGLAIVRGIVSLHRGTCSVQNTNEGADFIITLPQ